MKVIYGVMVTYTAILSTLIYVLSFNFCIYYLASHIGSDNAWKQLLDCRELVELQRVWPLWCLCITRFFQKRKRECALVYFVCVHVCVCVCVCVCVLVCVCICVLV